MKYKKAVCLMGVICFTLVLYGAENKKVVIKDGKDWQTIKLMQKQYEEKQNKGKKPFNDTRGNKLHQIEQKKNEQKK